MFHVLNHAGRHRQIQVNVKYVAIDQQYLLNQVTWACVTVCQTYLSAAILQCEHPSEQNKCTFEVFLKP